MRTVEQDFHLYVANADGSNQRQLVTPFHSNMYPDWSPDGLEMAFSSEDDFDIHAVNVTNGAVRNLTSIRGQVDKAQHPVWSPDGQYIAYVRYVSQENSINQSIVVVAVEPSDTSLITLHEGGVYGTPSWSPDSRYVAFFGYHFETGEALYVADLQQNGAARIVAENVYYSYEAMNMWSPDGRFIAFSPLGFSPNNDPIPASQLFLVEVATGDIHKIADIAAAYPVWQP
jgi:Tol biopolymer transport system component